MDRGSYFQEFMRSKALAKASTGKQAVEETKKLLTDRGAYISFLEIQLERVSAACLHTKSLETQIHDMHVQIEATDAKVATVAKLLKMHQQHTGDLMQSNTQDIGTMQYVVWGVVGMDRGSYFQEFMRSKALAKASTGKQAVEETKKLLTDRGAYISFLEIQLERVSAACLHTKSLETQIHDMHVQIEATDAKVATVAKLLKMHQQHTGDLMQSNTQDIGTMQSLIETIRDTVTAHGTQLRRLDVRQCDTDDAAQSMETKLRQEIDHAITNGELAKETMELHVQRYHTLHEAQQTKWQAIHAAHQELVHDIAIADARNVAHTDAAVQQVRNAVEEATAALEARLVEHEEKAKRARQAVEQYCAVEIARVGCAADAKLESIDQNAILLQDQLQRVQAKLAQMSQKHHDDCRLINASLVSLQSDLDDRDRTTIRPVLTSHGASQRGCDRGESSDMASRVAVLERDCIVFREGLEYLRRAMETFESSQVMLVEDWNAKLAQMSEDAKRLETAAKVDEDEMHKLQRRLQDEWCHKEEAWWKAVASLEIQVPALREKVQLLMDRRADEEPVVVEGVHKGLTRIHKMEKRMHRLAANMQTLYTLVEMTLPQRDKAFADLQTNVIGELAYVREALKTIMHDVGNKGDNDGDRGRRRRLVKAEPKCAKATEARGGVGAKL
ncbi:hypothetical protein, variant 2 [Aphanomyces invadans]|uniref:Uncharacterized protein n=1 Tax=Aphanomyces invadans TaxID=157072 RepID=A0A024UH03_9STRA|nr:hypothetical protein, variant 2 [Aphanomyces invadans]ETW05162.1 hypothetical protein, variant 2 [Aphanomyces invadans]|eukprot:XP_008866599.1 hypothetical protein, variant 2 [Aphanomyces invadans]